MRNFRVSPEENQLHGLSTERSQSSSGSSRRETTPARRRPSSVMKTINSNVEGRGISDPRRMTPQRSRTMNNNYMIQKRSSGGGRNKVEKMEYALLNEDLDRFIPAEIIRGVTPPRERLPSRSKGRNTSLVTNENTVPSDKSRRLENKTPTNDNTVLKAINTGAPAKSSGFINMINKASLPIEGNASSGTTSGQAGSNGECKTQ